MSDLAKMMGVAHDLPRTIRKCAYCREQFVPQSIAQVACASRCFVLNKRQGTKPTLDHYDQENKVRKLIVDHVPGKPIFE